MHSFTICCNVVVYSNLPMMCDWEPMKSIQGGNTEILFFNLKS